jgi:vacuolar-type H+-ATPase subunit E/Vma4
MTAGASEPLIETLLADARRSADALLDEARRRAERVAADAEALARTIESEAEATGRAEGERARLGRVALAEIEARQQRLAQRAALVREAIDTASRRFEEELAGADGAALLAGLVRRAARALGEAAVRVRARAEDRARLRRLRGDEVGAELSFDDEPLLEPGVLVSSADGRRVVRSRAADVVARREAALAAAAARALFEAPERP